MKFKTTSMTRILDIIILIQLFFIHELILQFWCAITHIKYWRNSQPPLLISDVSKIILVSLSLLNRVLGVLTWLACLRARVLGVLACSRAYVLGVLTCLACLRACMYMLCLRASYDACFACLPLTYSRFCLIIYFVCINQGFAIKRKLLIHVNLS